MRRRAALAALAVAFGSLAVAGPAAQACTGEVCDAVNLVCQVTQHRNCVA